MLAAVLLAVAVLGAGREGLPLLRMSRERGWEPWRDFQITRSMLLLDAAQRDYVGPGYGRDRDYALFLWNVQRSGPEARRIFLHVGDMQDWYRYRAAYRLAPMPVELFEPGREYGSGDVLLAWRAPVPDRWTVIFQSGDGALARPGEGP